MNKLSLGDDVGLQKVRLSRASISIATLYFYFLDTEGNILCTSPVHTQKDRLSISSPK